MTSETAEAIKARQQAINKQGAEPDLPPPNIPKEEELREDQFKIDYSKIKNLSALEQADREAANIVKTKVTERKRQKVKFSFNEPVLLQLPSHGKFYQDSNDENIKNGFIKMRPMSFAEEEIMTNPANLKSGTAILKLFESCIESDYPAENILSFDSTYLLYALRKESYGDDYEFEIECPECGKKMTQSIKISELSFAEMPEDVDDPQVLKLPKSGYTVIMVLPRLYHAEQLYRTFKNNEEISERILNFVIQTISIKDPKGKEISPNDYAEFYEALPAGDRAVITDAFKFDRGIDKVSFTCDNPRCVKEFKEMVPMGLSFFRY
ncbi:MAG: hypothetical protein LBF97_00670 [Elusimicrobiota bacterium]|jgi:hypothetical protein|nr:hypothetical protein [Elusimicrobiota bacterium]